MVKTPKWLPEVASRINSGESLSAAAVQSGLTPRHVRRVLSQMAQDRGIPTRDLFRAPRVKAG